MANNIENGNDIKYSKIMIPIPTRDIAVLVFEPEQRLSKPEPT